MVVETLLPAAAIGGTAGLAYATKRKIFPGAPTPDEENFVLPIKLKSANAEDINSRRVKGVRIPRRTLLTLGASGSGKSETLKHFADDLRADPNSQIVVYDHKRDYQEFFEDRGADMIRGFVRREWGCNRVEYL